jgi:hypothetical protein
MSENESQHAPEHAPEHECPICQSSLEHTQFLPKSGAEAEDIELNENEFRLACGHAFHTTCLCRSLRTESGCPVCRSKKAADPFTVSVDLEGNMSMVFTNSNRAYAVAEGLDDEGLEEFEFAPDIATATDLVNSLDQVRQMRTVQMTRKQFNKQKKEYRKLERELMALRRDHISGILEEFKKKHYVRFVQMRSKLQKSLQRLKSVERQGLEKIVPADKLPELLDTMQRVCPTEYAIAGHVGNNGNYGPLCKTFWTK